MYLRNCSIAALALVLPLSAGAASRCEQLLHAFGTQLADATCFAQHGPHHQQSDLTTPPDNVSQPAACRCLSPTFAFTPRTDRNISDQCARQPAGGDKTPITKTVPGLQINARIASDSQGQARFLLRLPDDWNGRLVVAGAPEPAKRIHERLRLERLRRAEGIRFRLAEQGRCLNCSHLTTSADPLGCRLNPASTTVRSLLRQRPWEAIHPWAAVHDRRGNARAHGDQGRLRWRAALTRMRSERRTAATRSRRAVELAPTLFDGGVDWEGTVCRRARAQHPHRPSTGDSSITPITSLPVTTPTARRRKNIGGAGYPPDIVDRRQPRIPLGPRTTTRTGR